MEEEVYDPLSQAQKHVMLRNGRLESEGVKQGTCCCGHSVNDHLDCVDCCLTKTKESCICERFIDKDYKMPIPQKQSKIPKEQEQIAEHVVKDGKVTQDEGRFMRQYGII
jgi:hypothetical protein